MEEAFFGTLIAMALLYVSSKIVFTTYFKAKANYCLDIYSKIEELKSGKEG